MGAAHERAHDHPATARANAPVNARVTARTNGAPRRGPRGPGRCADGRQAVRPWSRQGAGAAPHVLPTDLRGGRPHDPHRPLRRRDHSVWFPPAYDTTPQFRSDPCPTALARSAGAGAGGGRVRRGDRQPARTCSTCRPPRAARPSTRCSPARSTSPRSTRSGSPSPAARPASVQARIVRPAGATGTLPVILYIHGAGWVFGNAHTHDRLVRELAVGAGRRRGLPRVRPLPRGPLPGRHRAELRGRAVDRRRTARRKGLDAHPARGRRRLGRRQHDRRADADGQGARRRLRSSSRCCSTRSPTRTSTPAPTTSSPTGYFLRRDGMQWFWDQYTTDAGAAGRDHRLPAAGHRRAARRAAAGAGHHRRGRRAARRGRGVREQAARRPASRSPRCASRASSTTS